MVRKACREAQRTRSNGAKFSALHTSSAKQPADHGRTMLTSATVTVLRLRTVYLESDVLPVNSGRFVLHNFASLVCCTENSL